MLHEVIITDLSRLRFGQQQQREKTSKEMYEKDRGKVGRNLNQILSDVNLHLSYSEFQN